MSLKQISVTMPANLFKASKEYSQEYGYKNVQEFILDEIRKTVMAKRIARYEEIEAEIDKESKTMTQKEAIDFLLARDLYLTSISPEATSNIVPLVSLLIKDVFGLASKTKRKNDRFSLQKQPLEPFPSILSVRQPVALHLVPDTSPGDAKHPGGFGPIAAFFTIWIGCPSFP